MKKRLLYTLWVFALVGAMALAGCGPAPTATPVPPTPKPAATAVPPTEVPELDLAKAVGDYLSTIPDGFSAVKPDAAKEQIDVAKPFLLDVREPKEITDNGTIEGAVNIPLRTLAKNLDKLPAKDAPILMYCAVSYRGALGMEALQLLGYTNVKNISGGFNAWKAAEMPVASEAAEATAGQAPDVDPEMLAVVDNYLSSIPDGFYGIKPDAAKEQMDVAKPFILDVREPKELTDNGTIEGAVNIPLRTLADNLDKLPAKDTPIIMYCAVSYRGALGMEALQLLGYTNVKNISGGYNAWKAAEMPVVQPS